MYQNTTLERDDSLFVESIAFVAYAHSFVAFFPSLLCSLLFQPSDFDDFGMAQVCFEDMYLAIYKCDGPEWAQKLRQRTIPVLQGSPLEKFQKRYQDNWKTVHPVNVRSSVKQQQKVARKGKNTK